MSALSSQINRLGTVRFVALVALLAASLFYLAAGLYNVWQIESPALVNMDKPLGRDFVAFWSASHVALAGAPEAVFDLERLHAAEMAAVGAPVNPTAWHYPPTFLLIVLPLALLPYVPALILWLVVPLAALCLVACRLYRQPAVGSLVLLFPSVTLCLVSGQNGIITASLIGAALLTLDRRPVVAGVCFGLLTFKPHLALLVFPALALGGHVRALLASMATALAFLAASIAVLGIAPWQAFIANLPFVREVLDTGMVPWMRMPTVFVSAREIGFETATARLLQAVATLSALGVVCTIWWRRAPLGLRGAALIVAMPLATPYAFDYDLVALAFAIFWLARDGLTEGWLPGEEPLLFATWVSPALFWVIIERGGPPLMPLLLALLLAAVWRRAYRAAAAGMNRVPAMAH